MTASKIIITLAIILITNPTAVVSIDKLAECEKISEIDEIEIKACNENITQPKKGIWLGFAQLNGDTVYLNDDRKLHIGPGVLIHELGHTIGLKHGSGGIMNGYNTNRKKYSNNTKKIVSKFDEIQIINYTNKEDIKTLLKENQTVIYPHNDSIILIKDKKTAKYIDVGKSKPIKQIYGKTSETKWKIDAVEEGCC